MEITVLDTNFFKVDVIDVFNSLIWTDRYSIWGDFDFKKEASIEIANSLREDYYLQLKESEHTMIIETITLKTDIEEGNQFIARGRSLESILDRRIIWNQTTLNGSLQDGIKKLLNENAIIPSDANRKISNLIFETSTDPNVTSLSVDEQFRGENLYDVISGLCTNSGIGFKITLNSDNKFVFKLYAGTDRSYDQVSNPHVVFSPNFDNLSNTNYNHSKIPYKTVTLVGGEGEGSARKTYQVILSGGETELNRREIFTDARDISSLVGGVTISDAEYNTLLANRGLLNLIENSQSSSFEGKVDPTTTYLYGTHFFMGDIVQIENEYGIQGKSRITELIISQDLSGSDIFPTFEMIE